jgi:hypothetical protein
MDVRIECDDDSVELMRAQATELADFLWRGLLPGAAVAAGRLTEAPSSPPPRGVPPVQVEAYAWPAVRAGLARVR